MRGTFCISRRRIQVMLVFFWNHFGSNRRIFFWFGHAESSQELVSEDIATLSFVMEPGQSSGRGKRNSMPTKKAAALAALATKQQDTYKGSGNPVPDIIILKWFEVHTERLVFLHLRLVVEQQFISFKFCCPMFLDESNSPKKIIRFRHDSDDDYPAPKKSMPKIVLKNTSHTLSKRECDLIKDCVDALADQDSLGGQLSLKFSQMAIP